MNTLESAQMVQKIVNAPETLETARLAPSFFTRNRTMPFSNLLLFLLNPAKECLQVRLNNFFKNVQRREVTMTQQAISKARSHFDHSPFEKMTRSLVEREYSGEFPLKTWNGYHVFGIDGSSAILPNIPAMRNEFGVSGCEKACATAGISILQDVVHDWVVDALITKYPQNERDGAKRHIEFIETNLAHLQKKIVLMDRGYPSRDLLKYLEEKEVKFLCRCQKSWVSEVEAAPMGDSLCKLNGEQTVRVYKFTLPGGEIETLVTNLFDLPEDDLPELYFLRWRVEGKYAVLKNKVQLEDFSGCTKNAILQDFWASITLTILVSIAKAEADERLQKRNRNKNLTRRQMPNVSQLVASLKDEFILVCLYPSPSLQNFAINRVIEQISRAVSTFRPDRPSRPRSKLPKKKQYPMNRKSNI